MASPVSGNRFAPLLALVEDLPDDASAPPRRPISVRVLEVVAALASCNLAALLVVTWGWLDAGPFDDGRVAPVTLAGEIVLLAGLVATIVGCHRRAPFARWSGLALIALLFVLPAAATVFMLQVPSAPQDADSRLAGDAVILGFAAATLVPIAFWFRAYGFSPRSRAWFAAGGDRGPAAP